MQISRCPHIRAEIVGQVMRLVLDRPRSLNAHSLEMLCEIERLLDVANERPNVKRIVISSSRSGVFCAGGDIKAVAAYSHDCQYGLVHKYFQTNKRVLSALRSTPIEVVCLVNGICFGGGFGLSMASDVRIATQSSSFAMPEARIGFYPDVGASHFLAQMPGSVGRRLGGEALVLTALGAMECGIVDHLVDEPELEATQVALWRGAPIGEIKAPRTYGGSSITDATKALQPSGAGSLCPTSVAVADYLLSWGNEHSIDECLEYEADISLRMALRPDFVSGVTAVLGKRPLASWSPDDVDPRELAQILSCPLEVAREFAGEAGKALSVMSSDHPGF